MDNIENKMGPTKRRKILVNMFYRFLLMNNSDEYIKNDIENNIQACLDEESLKEISDILDKKTIVLTDIRTLLSSEWKWERLPAFIQSVLLVGAYEIKFTDTPKPITINEMVNIVKECEPDFDYKFINALLDKIIKF